MARRLHSQITPTYLTCQRKGRIRSHEGARDPLQHHIEKVCLTGMQLHDFCANATTDAKKRRHCPGTLAGHAMEAQTVRYLRDKEIPLVYGPKFKQ